MSIKYLHSEKGLLIHVSWVSTFQWWGAGEVLTTTGLVSVVYSFWSKVKATISQRDFYSGESINYVHRRLKVDNIASVIVLHYKSCNNVTMTS